jgi:hypothetical protein
LARPTQADAFSAIEEKSGLRAIPAFLKRPDWYPEAVLKEHSAETAHITFALCHPSLGGALGGTPTLEALNEQWELGGRSPRSIRAGHHDQNHYISDIRVCFVATSRFCSSGIASDARLPTREPKRDFEGQNGG